MRIHLAGRYSMRVRLAKLMLTCGVLIVGASASALQGIAWAGSPNGVSGSMPAYYDHKIFTINFFQLATAQATLLAKNNQQNTIYQSDPGLPGGEPFIRVEPHDCSRGLEHGERSQPDGGLEHANRELGRDQDQVSVNLGPRPRKDLA